jgi:predicted Mrr-cat superfamily restriction endonuclease
MTNVWWLAIARNEGHASFEELEARGVIAQGWPALGDMTRFLDENKTAEPAVVIGRLAALLREAYPDEAREMLPGNLYNFFFGIQPGDLVIGIEGSGVRGICEVPVRCSYSYRAEARDGRAQNYAHERGPVKWLPWEEFSPDWALPAPGRTLAVAGMQDSRDEIVRRFRSEGWQETLHLLSNPKNAERLVRSIHQMDAGETDSRILTPVRA